MTEIEDGKIWFTPLQSMHAEHPEMPDNSHQGFKYIEGWPKSIPRSQAAREIMEDYTSKT